MKTVLSGLFAILLTMNTYAASSSEKVEELLNLMNMDSLLESTYDQMEGVFAQVAGQVGVRPEDRDIFDKYMKNVVKAMKEEMTWEKMKGPLTEVYQNNFSEQEIDAMLKFYRTEEGRSIIEKMPKVMQDSMMISQSLMQSFFPRLKEIAAELEADLKERHSKE